MYIYSVYEILRFCIYTCIYTLLIGAKLICYNIFSLTFLLINIEYIFVYMIYTIFVYMMYIYTVYEFFKNHVYMYIYLYMKIATIVYIVYIYMLYIHFLYISYIHKDTQGCGLPVQNWKSKIRFVTQINWKSNIRCLTQMKHK